MTSQHKLIAGTVVVAVLAGGGAALAAIELSSSPSPSAAPAVTTQLGGGIGSSYGLGGGRLGGRGLGGGLGPGDNRGGFDDGPRRGAGAGLLGSSLTAAAAYLAVPAAALRSDLAGGQTLAQVAKAQGKTVDGLVAAIVAAQKKAFATAIANGTITQAQAQFLEARIAARTRDLVNGVRPQGPLGGDGDGGFQPGAGGPGGSGGGSGGTGTFGGSGSTA